MDVLNRGSEYLHYRARSVAASPVVYSRPGVGSVTVKAIFGRRNEISEDATGLEIWTKQPDFTVIKEDLVLQYKRIVPQRGDQITADINGDSQTYDVISKVEGDPPGRHTDRFGWAWRIHCIRTKVNR